MAIQGFSQGFDISLFHVLIKKKKKRMVWLKNAIFC